MHARQSQLMNGRPVGLADDSSRAAYVVGAVVAVGAHVLIPLFLLASSWLLTVLGLAIPVAERERPALPDNVIAAEFVRLGKPIDPNKLPNRKVPPKVKRRPDSVAVSKEMNPEPKPPKKEEENPPEAEDDLLDNLVDRAKAFAEDVEVEQEGDPNGLADGTATEARAGDIYRGQLVLFFRRGWTVPNVVRSPEKLATHVDVEVADDGLLRAVSLRRTSGDPLFDQSVIDRVEALIRARAILPEPPVELRGQFYGQVLPIAFDGRNLR